MPTDPIKPVNKNPEKMMAGIRIINFMLVFTAFWIVLSNIEL